MCGCSRIGDLRSGSPILEKHESRKGRRRGPGNVCHGIAMAFGALSRGNYWNCRAVDCGDCAVVYVLYRTKKQDRRYLCAYGNRTQNNHKVYNTAASIFFLSQSSGWYAFKGVIKVVISSTSTQRSYHFMTENLLVLHHDL